MNVGIVGFGNMGRAVAAGLSRREENTPFVVYDTFPAAREAAQRDFGARVCTTPAELCAASDLIVLAIKPQNTEGFFFDFKEHTAHSRVLSVVAGRRIAYLRNGLGTNRVVRCMPSLAATVGLALVGVTIPADVDAELRRDALAVIHAIGTPVEVHEDLLAAITGISGSGIAYVFSFLHAMALGGVKAGLTYPVALTSALTVLKGAVALVENGGEHPISLLSKVASPAGTTIEGIDALERHAFTAAVMEAVERAARRAEELER
jgi:pyrroline-5-carboxylate reductase